MKNTSRIFNSKDATVKKWMCAIFTYYFTLFTVLTPSLNSVFAQPVPERTTTSQLEISQTAPIFHDSDTRTDPISDKLPLNIDRNNDLLYPPFAHDAQPLFYYNFLRYNKTPKYHYFDGINGATARINGQVSLNDSSDSKRLTSRKPPEHRFLGNSVSFDSDVVSDLFLSDTRITSTLTLTLPLKLTTQNDQVLFTSIKANGGYNLLVAYFNGHLVSQINSETDKPNNIDVFEPQKKALRLTTNQDHHVVIAINDQKNHFSLVRIYIDGVEVGETGFQLNGAIDPEQHIGWGIGGSTKFPFKGSIGPVVGFAGSFNYKRAIYHLRGVESAFTATKILATPALARGINTQRPDFPVPDSLAGIREMTPSFPSRFGNARINYPLKVPSGVNGLTPALSLQYINSKKPGNLSVGWHIPFSAIEVSTLDGVPQYNGREQLLLDGEKIVEVDKNRYRFKRDNKLWIIERRAGNYFIVMRPDGSKQYYGINDDSKLSDGQLQNKTYKWLLSRVEDSFGNSMEFHYEARLREIHNVSYYAYKRLNAIHYGLYDSNQGYSHRVLIKWRPENEYFVRTNMRPGFPTENDGLIDRISMQYRIASKTQPLSTTYDTIRQYRFEYREPSPNALDKYLLRSVTETYGLNQEVINQYVFTYNLATTLDDNAPNAALFPLLAAFAEPASIDVEDFSNWYRHEYAASTTEAFAQARLPLGLSSRISQKVFVGYMGAYDTNIIVDFTDINGDGLPDFVGHSADHPLDVILNTGEGFTESQLFSNSNLNECETLKRVLTAETAEVPGHMVNATANSLRDANGDGRPDLIGYSRPIRPTPVRAVVICFNKGDRFAESVELRSCRLTDAGEITDCDYAGKTIPVEIQMSYFEPVRGFSAEGTTLPFHSELNKQRVHTEADLLDMNGDGWLDLVRKRSGFDFQVLFNTGERFESTTQGRFPHPPFNGLFGNQSLWGERFPATSTDWQDLRQFRNFGARNWHIPFYDLETFETWDLSKGVSVDLIDINGDGLPDRIAKPGVDFLGWMEDAPIPILGHVPDFAVQLNTGYGFMAYHNWERAVNHDLNDPWRTYPLYGSETVAEDLNSYPSGRNTVDVAEHIVTTLIDLDGDGLLDRLAADYGARQTYVQFNTGDRFGNIYRVNVLGLGYGKEWIVYEQPESDYPYKNVARIVHAKFAELKDVTGDGLPDQIEKRSDEYSDKSLHLRRNQFTLTTFLQRIENRKTGTEITLKYDHQALNPEESNYRITPVLRKIITRNRSVSPVFHQERTFEYGKGTYDAKNRRLVGFDFVLETSRYLDVEKDEWQEPAHYQTVNYIISTLWDQQDLAGNPEFNEYLTGKVEMVESGVVIGAQDQQRRIPQSKVRIEFTRKQLLSPSEELPLRGAVAAVYPEQTWNTVFNDEGIVVAELEETVTINFDDNGLFEDIESYLDGPYGIEDLSSTITFGLKFEADGNDDSRLRYHLAPETFETKHVDLTLKKVGLAYTDDTLAIESVKENIYLNGVATGEESVSSVTYDSKGNVASLASQGVTTEIETLYTFPDQLPESIQSIFMEQHVTRPDQTQATVRFDVLHRLKEKVDRFGDRHLFDFDTYGRNAGHTLVRNEGSLTMSRFVYNREGDLFKVEANYANPTGPAGETGTTTVQYYKDGLGREVQVKQEADINGTRSWIVSGPIDRDVRGRVIRKGTPFKYDIEASGLIGSDIEFIREPIVYDYDLFNRVRKITQSNGYEISMTHEQFVELTPSSGGIERLVFKKTTTDNYGFAHSVISDALGRTIRKTNKTRVGSIHTTEFEHDLLGNMHIIEPEGIIGGSVHRDSAGRIRSVNTPDAGTKRYIYNKKGLLEKVIDHGLDDNTSGAWLPREAMLIYDDTNRLILVDRPGEDNDVGIAYYSIEEADTDFNRYRAGSEKSMRVGSLKHDHIENISYEVEFDYATSTEVGNYYIVRETKTIEGERFSTQYTYDVLGRISRITYPEEAGTVGYIYDRGARLKTMYPWNPEGGVTPYLTIFYDNRAQRERVEYGNGSIQSFSYRDDTGQLESARLVNPRALQMMDSNGVIHLDDEVLIDLRYDYYINGLVKSLEDKGSSEQTISLQSYSFDSGNRISGAKGNYWDGEAYWRSFLFDGSTRLNEKGMEVSGKRTEFITQEFDYYPGRHALESITPKNRFGQSRQKNDSWHYKYDRYGNMRSRERVSSDQIEGSELIKYPVDSTDKVNAKKKQGRRI